MWKTPVVFSQVDVNGGFPVGLEIPSINSGATASHARQACSSASARSGAHCMWSADTFRTRKLTASSLTGEHSTPSNLLSAIEAHCSATTEMNGCIAPVCTACLHMLRRVNDNDQPPWPGPRPEAQGRPSAQPLIRPTQLPRMASAAAAG